MFIHLVRNYVCRRVASVDLRSTLRRMIPTVAIGTNDKNQRQIDSGSLIRGRWALWSEERGSHGTRQHGMHKMRCARSVAAAAVAISVIHVPAAYSQAGALDPSFGADGRVSSDVFGGFDDRISDIAIQSDGKIIAAGSRGGYASRYNFALVRYLSNGAVDSNFGSAGRVLLDFDGDDDFAGAIAIQQDGKIVVAGSARLGGRPSDFAIARYNLDGSLDPTFAGNGKAATDFGAEESISDIAIQTDGKIVAVGTRRVGGGPSEADCDNDVAVARYDADGTLDTTFSYNGKLFTGVGCDDHATAVAIQSDGKIVVVGFRVEEDSGRCFNCLDSDLIALRYRADGSLDPGFDHDGKWSSGLGGWEGFSDVKIQTDGRIVAAGHQRPYGYLDGRTDKFFVQRFNPSGSLDEAFGLKGRKWLDIPGARRDGATGLALQPDGKIVLVGSAESDATGYNFAVARLTQRGLNDTSFSGNGVLMTDFGGSDAAYAVALQRDGRIIVGGVTSGLGRIAGPEHQGGDEDFAIARYLVR
jgi:uncharacterized delta-60 repeat protein